MVITSKMCGVGKYIFNDGDYHEGLYQNDVKNGYGIMYLKSEKKRFEGNYKDDKKNGYGEFIGDNEKIIEKGIFDNNNLINPQ